MLSKHTKTMSKTLTIESTFSLLSGNKLPILGFGVWDSPNNVCTQSCLEALKVGYRHIDTAQGYGNEAEVGEAVKQSKLSRKDLFITSKIFSPGEGAKSTYDKLIESVRKIDGQDGYIDLFLIHNANVGAEKRKLMWQAMEKVLDEGKFKSIGVSNFGIGHLEQMKDYAKVWPPAVNQLELHPWLQQQEVVDYCHKNKIAVEAYCPLVRNQKADDPTLKAVAEKHSKTTAQILLRYCLQKDWSPLPKSDNPGRIAQNADLYGFELDEEDMEKLNNVKEEPALVIAVDNKSKD